MIHHEQFPEVHRDEWGPIDVWESDKADAVAAATRQLSMGSIEAFSLILAQDRVREAQQDRPDYEAIAADGGAPRTAAGRAQVAKYDAERLRRLVDQERECGEAAAAVLSRPDMDDTAETRRARSVLQALLFGDEQSKSAARAEFDIWQRERRAARDVAHAEYERDHPRPAEHDELDHRAAFEEAELEPGQ